MSKRQTTVPPPYTATQPNPGARVHTDADWVRRDRVYKESLPQPDYSKGSEAGINNG